jgi:molybdopterin molybdotransferase
MHPVRGEEGYGSVLRRVLALPPLAREPETVLLGDAVGRISAADVAARLDLPRAARAALDGYAVRSDDLRGASPRDPARLQWAGAVRPGVTPRRPKPGPGRAIAIATGATVPAGADAVVPVEATRRRGRTIRTGALVSAGDGIDAPGSDVRAGTPLLRKGDVVTPVRLAGLAAQGLRHVRVLARPTVAVQPTGREIRRPGERLAPGEIYDSNGVVTAALARAGGAQVYLRSPLGDEPRTLERRLREERADVLAVIGGSSAGREDHLARAVERTGEIWVHGIAVQPGRPTLLGRVGGRVVIGLPGHPASCVAAATLFLRPIVERLAGGPPPRAPDRRPLAEALELPRPVTYFRPVRVQPDGVRSTFSHASCVSSFADADGYLLVPGPARWERGRLVDVHPL